MEMTRSLRPFKILLPLVALLIASLAITILLVAPTLKAVTLPAPGEATDAQALEVWEQLSAAIQRDDHDGAVCLAEWLDKRQETKGQTLTVPYSRIVELWCQMPGHGYEFCEEAAVDNDPTP